MESNYKNLIAFTIGGFILGFVLTYGTLDGTYHSNKKVQDLKLELAKRDTLILIGEEAVKKIGKENLSLIEERDLYKGKFDTSLAHIVELSKPVVKKKDINEALKWVDEYNSTVE